MNDTDRLIEANTKLVDENKYLKIDKEKFLKDIKIFMNLISRYEIEMNTEEIEVYERYYYMVRGNKNG